MADTNKLMFSVYVSEKGASYALLTDNPGIAEVLRDAMMISNQNLGVEADFFKVDSDFDVDSDSFQLIEEEQEASTEIFDGFSKLAGELLKGIDILFFSFNLGFSNEEGLRNKMMDDHKYTDFVNTYEQSEEDAHTQPYMVSYSVPRSENPNRGSQHRVFCQLSTFSLCQANNSISVQRGRGTKVEEQRADRYVVSEDQARQALNEFVALL